MTTIGERLTTKIGPLPVVAWAGIAAGAYVVYAYATRGSSSEPSASPVTGFPGEVGDADDFSDSYGNATGGYNVNAGTVTSTTPNQGIMDVSTWAQRSIGYLIANGYTVTDATTAIWNYLNHEETALTSTQIAAWEQAIKSFGLPPGGEYYEPPTKQGSTTTTPPPSDNTDVPWWALILVPNDRGGTSTEVIGPYATKLLAQTAAHAVIGSHEYSYSTIQSATKPVGSTSSNGTVLPDRTAMLRRTRPILRPS